MQPSDIVNKYKKPLKRTYSNPPSNSQVKAEIKNQLPGYPS